MAAELERLVTWYRAQCNGDWEHQHGVRLGTLDNPGWSLDVSLIDTPAELTTAPRTMTERSEHDWVFFEVKDGHFRGRCGPGNLAEMLAVFLDLVDGGGNVT
jgi:hypothetical protein